MSTTPPLPPEDDLIPLAREQYLAVPRWRYIALFLVLASMLAVFHIDLENRTDYGLQRVERLWGGHSLLYAPQEPESPPQLANRLGVSSRDLLAAQHVVDAQMDYLGTTMPLSWRRILAIDFGDRRYIIGGPLLISTALAAVLAMLLYARQRGRLAEELVDYQATKFLRLSGQLEAKMDESTRIIEKFNRLQDKLLEAEKLASIGQLSATLAHEIRNPLTIIKSSTEIIEDDLPKGSPAESALALVRDEINRLDHIITDMLNFARPKEPKLERIWIRSLVRHWIPPVVEELEKESIQIVPQMDVDGEVVIDPDQLYQVFLNLMWNARDALRGHHNPHVFVRIADGGDYMCLVIQDTGIGMLPEVLRSMREPFFTTKTQGTGLGVPVSIQLIEGMGGRFEVASVLEEGTTVTLHLPRVGMKPRRASGSSTGIALGEGLVPPP